MRARHRAPRYRHLHNVHAQLAGQEQQLGVEGPGLDLLEYEQTLGSAPAKRLQGTLAVIDVRQQEETHRLGIRLSGKPASEATPASHIGTVGLTPDADSEVGAAFEGLEETREVFGR